MTHPGDYAEMLEHVAVHRYFLGLDLSRDVSWDEAVRSWYETLFRPMTETIRASGILDDFPGRTEADLYLFTARHLHDLRQRWGDDVAPGRAIKHLRLQTQNGAERSGDEVLAGPEEPGDAASEGPDAGAEATDGPGG